MSTFHPQNAINLSNMRLGQKKSVLIKKEKKKKIRRLGSDCREVCIPEDWTSAPLLPLVI